MYDQALLAALRRQNPLIHCISNIVSANDCANLLLAVGASPIMAQEAAEMDEIVARAQAVVLNTGTPDAAKFKACARAGVAANRRGVPVVLDPVGAGASRWRLESLRALLKDVRPSIVRVNCAEAAALLGQGFAERGVDSRLTDLQTRVSLAAALAREMDCAVLLSASEDVIAGAGRIETVGGGSARMRRITGAGCMLSVLCGAFASVAPPFEAARQASGFWKAAAAEAEALAGDRGMGSFRVALTDVTDAASRSAPKDE